MLPSPTQPAPVQTASHPQPTIPAQEMQVKTSTPARRRVGQTPLARILKAILRPVLKGLYYLISWIRKHFAIALAALLLLVASIVLTTYFVTGALPFANSTDTVQQNLKSSPQVSPDVVNWLVALRDADASTMLTLQKSISTSTKQPDSSLYIMQFSEKYGQVKWTGANITSNKTGPDGLVDTFVQVNMTSTNTSSTSNGTKLMSFWHFITAPGGQILSIEYVSSRQVG